MLKTCIACGTPTRNARCPKHTRPKPGRTRQDQTARAHLVANATTCWICGQPPRPGDPLTADHIIPRAHGGPDHPSNYAPAHRSCNSRRGSAIVT